MNKDAQQLQAQLYYLRGFVQDLPEEDRTHVAQLIAQLQVVVRDAYTPAHAALALSMATAEHGIKVAEEG